MKPLNAAILISGNGSNLQAIIDAKAAYQHSYTIRAVISSQATAFGLTRAANHHIETAIENPHSYPSRQHYHEHLLNTLKGFSPDLIVLAGFMHKLEGDILTTYRGRIINVHPSLLPKYPGLHTHEKVLKNGDSEHGMSIHFVDETLDGGPIICQAKFTVSPASTADLLQKQVQTLEHKAYPKVINWIAHGRIRLIGDHVQLDGTSLPDTGKLLNL